MAEKRMVHRNITKSDKLLRIAQTRGWRAFSMYMAHIPFLDKAGRMKANPLGLKGTLWEAHPVTADELAGDLDALAAVGLIRIYRTPKGEMVMQYAKFDEEHGGFNKPHPNEPESEFPDADADGCVGAQARDVLAAVGGERSGQRSDQRSPERSDKVAPEYEIEYEKEKENTNSQDLQPSSTSLTRTHPHEAFAEAWNQHRGHLPATRSLDAKRKRAIDTLRKEHPTDALDLFRDATQCVAADEFWVQRQYGIDNLLRPGRVLEKAEKWRAGVTQLGEANIRMATQVDRWARALDQADDRPVN
jgi:hypothetical protein